VLQFPLQISSQGVYGLQQSGCRGFFDGLHIAGNLRRGISQGRISPDKTGKKYKFLDKFTYQHKVGEPEIIRHILIAACTYEQAVELGNQRLARDFPGEQDGGTYYSTDGSEAAKMVDCKELLQGFYPDEYPAGIQTPRFNLYPDLCSEALQSALALLQEISGALIDETVVKMEQAGLFKPGQLDALLTDDEPWRAEQKFGAKLAVDYLRERFGRCITAVVNGANAR
jgi:hypothetical protein